jgi:aconitate hydratase
MLRDYTNESKTPAYSEVHELDLSTVVPCVSGPKRPQDKIVLVDLKNEFRNSLTNQMGLNVSI